LLLLNLFPNLQFLPVYRLQLVLFHILFVGLGLIQLLDAVPNQKHVLDHLLDLLVGSVVFLQFFLRFVQLGLHLGEFFDLVLQYITGLDLLVFQFLDPRVDLLLELLKLLLFLLEGLDQPGFYLLFQLRFKLFLRNAFLVDLTETLLKVSDLL